MGRRTESCGHGNEVKNVRNISKTIVRTWRQIDYSGQIAQRNSIVAGKDDGSLQGTGKVWRGSSRGSDSYACSGDSSPRHCALALSYLSRSCGSSSFCSSWNSSHFRIKEMKVESIRIKHQTRISNLFLDRFFPDAQALERCKYEKDQLWLH